MRERIKKIGRLLSTYKYSIAYVVLIVLLNTLFAYIPLSNLFGAEVSPMDWTVGIVYVLRDFAQRELRHKVLVAMLIAGLLSFWLAGEALAIASISAFFVAELVDWAVYTFTRRSLSERILWSASLSAPLDGAVFLAVIHQFNWSGVLVLSAAKLIGVVIVWLIWRKRAGRAPRFDRPGLLVSKALSLRRTSG